MIRAIAAWPALRVGTGWLVAAVLLAACASPGPRLAREDGFAGQDARESVLDRRSHWSLSGRLAVSDGRDGGSGRIDWRQRGEEFVIEIRAPVSRRTWRLSGRPGRAVLEGLEGGAREGSDAEALLAKEVGWQVPFADLHAWARGMRGEGAAELEFDPAGRPSALRQRGWTVEYRGWDDGEPPLPMRVFASKGERRVRLVVERWHDGSAG